MSQQRDIRPTKSPCTYEVHETLPAHWGRPCLSLFVQIQLSLRTGESLQGPHAAGRAARREGSKAPLPLPGSLPGPLGRAGAGPTPRPRPGASPTDHSDAQLLALVAPLLCTGEELPERLRGFRKEQGGAGRGQSPGQAPSCPGHVEAAPRTRLRVHPTLQGPGCRCATHLWEAGRSD